MHRNRATFRCLSLAEAVGIFGKLGPFLKAEANAFVIGCSLILFLHFCKIVSCDLMAMKVAFSLPS